MRPELPIELPIPEPKEEADLLVVDFSEVEVMEKLGQGGLAIVHRAKFQGTVGAVKLCRDQGFLTSGQMEMDRNAVQEEAMLLHCLKHPLLVEVVAIIQKQGQVSGVLLELLGPTLYDEARAPGFQP